MLESLDAEFNTEEQDKLWEAFFSTIIKGRRANGVPLKEHVRKYRTKLAELESVAYRTTRRAKGDANHLQVRFEHNAN